MHFFGSKDTLFQAAVGWPLDPARLAAQIAAPGPEGIGARIARAFLGSWDDPTTRASLAGMLRSAMTHDASAALLREFVVHQLFARVTGLAASHLIGVAILRYTLRVEPIASARTDQLVAWLTPALTHYLGQGGQTGGARARCRSKIGVEMR